MSPGCVRSKKAPVMGTTRRMPGLAAFQSDTATGNSRSLRAGCMGTWRTASSRECQGIRK